MQTKNLNTVNYNTINYNRSVFRADFLKLKCLKLLNLRSNSNFNPKNGLAYKKRVIFVADTKILHGCNFVAPFTFELVFTLFTLNK